jgi:hypothetical protein
MTLNRMSVLTFRVPALSDIELHYPFNPRSREFFESMPIEDSLSSKEVLQQAESRLMNAIGRSGYEPHLSELVEFVSFFVGALVASQDGYLTAKYARRESERSREFFVKESLRAKSAIFEEFFGVQLTIEEEGKCFVVKIEDYLGLVSRYDLTRIQRWKLVRQALANGVIYLTHNQLNDLFADCAQRTIEDGVRNLRRAAFPKELVVLRDTIMRYLPTQSARPAKSYAYIDELLKHPVSDGRHRLVWLVLAPYLVNVKKLDEEEAIQKIRSFVSVAGETRDLKRFVEYNVRRARRNGLMPPTLTTLKAEHPDLYSLLPKEVLAVDTKPTSTNSKARTSG